MNGKRGAGRSVCLSEAEAASMCVCVCAFFSIYLRLFFYLGKDEEERGVHHQERVGRRRVPVEIAVVFVLMRACVYVCVYDRSVYVQPRQQQLGPLGNKAQTRIAPVVRKAQPQQLPPELEGRDAQPQQRQADKAQIGQDGFCLRILLQQFP